MHPRSRSEALLAKFGMARRAAGVGAELEAGRREEDARRAPSSSTRASRLVRARAFQFAGLGLLTLMLLGAVNFIVAAPVPSSTMVPAGGGGRLNGGAADLQATAWDPMHGVLGTPDERHMHGDRIGLRADGTPGLPLRPYVNVRHETREQKRAAHNHTCFNLKRSDSLPLDRPAPDARSAACRATRYAPTLPAASIVIVFVDEPLSPLLRSVHSVLHRTPPRLLREVILVDDGSTGRFHQTSEYEEQASRPSV